MSDRKLLEANAHVSSEEVERDIVETVHEIEALMAMSEGLKVLADRVLDLRVEVGIRQRREFVSKLKDLLAARERSGSGE